MADNTYLQAILQGLIPQTIPGIFPQGAAMLLQPFAERFAKGLTAPVATGVGQTLQSPEAIGLAEDIYPGLGRSAFKLGEGLQGAGSQLDFELAQMNAERDKKIAAITGQPVTPEPSAQPGSQMTSPPPPTTPEAPPADPEGWKRVITPVTLPDGRVVFTNQPWEQQGGEIDPNALSRWKAKAALTQGEGPFSVREGSGGYSSMAPSNLEEILAGVPGMSAKDYEAATASQSPAVQELMQRKRAESEASARAELERKVLERQAMTPQELAGEQFTAYEGEQAMIRKSIQPEVDQQLAAALAQLSPEDKADPEKVAALRAGIENGLFIRRWNEYMDYILREQTARAMGSAPHLGSP